jgi:hypothetical protein
MSASSLDVAEAALSQSCRTNRSEARSDSSIAKGEMPQEDNSRHGFCCRSPRLCFLHSDSVAYVANGVVVSC